MKILVLYTSAGYGHKKIGENIAEVLKTEHQVDLLDLFSFAGGKTAEWGTTIYLKLLEFLPGLWEFFYTNSVFLNIAMPWRTYFARFKAIKVANLLINKHYDAVICTQVTASAIVSYLKQKKLFNGKFVIAFSDFHLHPFWLYDNADLYLANIPEQKEQMVARGVAGDKIFVCGITLPRLHEVDKSVVRGDFGLGEGDKTILVLGGGRGLGIDTKTIDELSKVDAKLIIVCGQNEELRQRLEKFYNNKLNIRVLGFVDYLPSLYAIASIVVTKPGGLTIAECLQHKLPILISSFIPGQERLNYEYLWDKNLIMPEIVDLYGPVADELKTGAFAEALNTNPILDIIVQDGSAVKQAIKSL